jgi:LPS-assembly lipoprotein
LPFESLYIAMPDYSVVGASLKRAIRASGTTRLALTASDAQATFLPGAEYRDRVILSVSGTGRVSELRLRYLYPTGSPMTRAATWCAGAASNWSAI